MELDDIKKLRPEERIEKLKELEKSHQKDLLESEKLLEEARFQIEDERRMKNIPIPELSSVDLSKIFGGPQDGLEHQAELASEAALLGILGVSEEVYHQHAAYHVVDDIGTNDSDDQIYRTVNMLAELKKRSEGVRLGSYEMDKVRSEEVFTSKSIVRGIFGEFYDRIEW